MFSGKCRMSVALDGFHAVKHALRFAPALVETVVVADPAAAARIDLAPALRRILPWPAAVDLDALAGL